MEGGGDYDLLLLVVWLIAQRVLAAVAASGLVLQLRITRV